MAVTCPSGVLDVGQFEKAVMLGRCICKYNGISRSIEGGCRRWGIHRVRVREQRCGKIERKTHETHLVFFGVAGDGEELRVVVEASGSNRCGEIAYRFERFWTEGGRGVGCV